MGKQVIAGIVAAFLLGWLLPLAAQTQPPAAPEYLLDIPRLPVIDALKEFTTQTGLLISFWPDAKTDQTLLIGPLRGKFSAEVALTRLLAASGLVFKRTNERSLVVMAPSLMGTPRNGVTVADPDPDRLADGQSHSHLQTRQPTLRTESAEKSGSTSDRGTRTVDPLDEMIVTGSRIERSGEGSAPVQVFTRRMIDDLGAASIPDVLRYTPQQPFVRAEHYHYNGAQYSQMRGIGVDTTLVLVNGRRVVPTSNSLTLNAFDLNSIPLAAVDTIEVLSDSASAIYGADAMGGVVNVVLKKDIPQPVIDVQYGGASGGADLLRTSFSAGYTAERFRTSLIFDYYQRDFLFGAERDRWANQDYRRYGGTDYRSAADSPGNVRSKSGARLFTGDRTSTLSTLSIVPRAQQLSLALFSEYDLTPGLAAFSEVLYANRETTSQDELYSVQGASVPQANPFNPYGQPVLVDFLLTGIAPRRFIHDMQMMRGVGGLRGSLGSTWQWEVAATASTETDDAVATNQINAARVSAALAATDPASALNPFIDGPAGRPDLLASLIEQNVHRHFSRGRQFSAFTSGELFDLPAGPLQAVIGGEWRDESVIYDALNEAVDAGRDVRAAFTELRVPLIGAAATRRDVLSMTLAARLDDYSDFGSTLNPQFGLMWRPTQDVLFRGSYGTSFRPPSLFELHSPRITAANVQVVDRARGNAIGNVPLVIGGNAGLRPIEADSMTAGFVLTPSAAPELRLLASYWRVATEHRVTLMHFSSLLAHEELFSDRVVRDQPTPQDLVAGVPGRLLRLDVSRMNFGHLATNGVDVEVNYAIETKWGSFLPRVSATWVNEFTAVDVPTTTPIDRVAVANSAGSIPRWRVVGTLGWRRNGVALSTTVDWTSAYLDANASGPTGRRLPPRALVDVQGSVAVDEMLGSGAMWQDLKLQVGVKNLFDEMPPFAEIGFGIGFDSSQGDLVGRLGYIRLSKGF